MRGGFRTALAYRDIQQARNFINALHEKNYVALSYTWQPSKFEGGNKGRYEVQTRDKRDFYPSPVRNCVFDRILTPNRCCRLDLALHQPA